MRKDLPTRKCNLNMFLLLIEEMRLKKCYKVCVFVHSTNRYELFCIDETNDHYRFWTQCQLQSPPCRGPVFGLLLEDLSFLRVSMRLAGRRAGGQVHVLWKRMCPYAIQCSSSTLWAILC